MGTSGAYSGSGGKLGRDLRDGISDWIDSLPSDPTPPDGERPGPRIDPEVLLKVVGLIRPRPRGGSGGDGPGGGGGGTGGSSGGASGTRGGGGPSRSVGRSAGTAGRAAAAAYAFRTGDADTLRQLGLDYTELAALGDQFEVTRRIVEAACGPRADSTIEDHEQRLVAADVAEWVLTQEESGSPPSPEEIVRKTLSLVIADAVLSESGEIVNNSANADFAEGEIRDAAEALADRATFSVDGVTEAEFTDAIESGIETLRDILNGGT